MVLLFILLVSVFDVCLAERSNPNSGAVKELTPQDIADYSGNAINVSAAAWEKFVKEMPKQLIVAKDSINAIIIHQKLSKGDVPGAIDTLLQYLGGVILSEAEAAGHGPWATVTTLFQAYCAANDIIKDRIFIPGLFDDLYAKYKRMRDSGETHESAWDETLSAAKGTNPLLADIKARVIYPEFNAKSDGSGVVKASRVAKGSAAGRQVVILNLEPEDWKYPQKRPLIRHKGNGVGGPRFRRVIDIEITGLVKDNADKYVDEIMDGVLKLNEFNYRNDPGYMKQSQIDEVRKTVASLLKVILNQKPGETLDREAVAYLGAQLQKRYAKEKVSETMSVKADEGKKELGRIAQTLIEIDQDLKKGKSVAGVLPKASAYLPDPKLLPLPEGYQEWFMQKGRMWDQVVELAFGPAKIMQAQAEYSCRYDSNLVKSKKLPRREVKIVKMRVTVTTTDNPQNMLKHYRELVENKTYSVMPWNDNGEPLGVGKDGRIRNVSWAWMKLNENVYFDVESQGGIFIREFCQAALKR